MPKAEKTCEVPGWAQSLRCLVGAFVAGGLLLSALCALSVDIEVSVLLAYCGAILFYAILDTWERHGDEDLFTSNTNGRTFCSNISSFLSLGVIATFLVLPWSAYMHALLTDDHLRAGFIPWRGIAIVAFAPLGALAIAGYISRKEFKLRTAERKHSQSCPNGISMTYLYHIQRWLKPNVCIWVLFLVVVYTLFLIVGEIGILSIVYEALLADILPVSSRVMVVLSIIICCFYVCKGRYRTVLSTDVFQLVLLVSIVGALLGVSLNTGGLGLGSHQDDVLFPREAAGSPVTTIQILGANCAHRWFLSVLHYLSIAGIILGFIAWLTMAPSSWILNVSTRAHDACEKNQRSPSSIPLVGAGAVLGALLLLVAYIGVVTTHTTLKEVPSQGQHPTTMDSSDNQSPLFHLP